MPRKAKGPNGETLPAGLYWDGKYFRIRPLPGYPRERAGKHKGRALQLLKERRAQIRYGQITGTIVTTVLNVGLRRE